MVEISYNIKSPEWKKNLPSYKKCISNSVNQIFKIIKFSSNNEISISFLLTSNSEIKLLNQKYRNKNKPTNVLSFTNEDVSKQITNNLGDIAISYEYVECEAKEQDKKFDDHVVHMFIHGIYHILGFDHKDDLMADEMENKEIILLKKLNINNPYN